MTDLVVLLLYFTGTKFLAYSTCLGRWCSLLGRGKTAYKAAENDVSTGRRDYLSVSDFT